MPRRKRSSISGSVYGGQQPVSGAAIQLYAVGTSGYGSAATSMLNTTVYTGSDGKFSITGDYACPAAGTAFGPSTPVYMVASGGNPGLSPGTNNGSLVLMAGLGHATRSAPPQ